MDNLNKCLENIKKINEIEFQKNNKKYNLKIVNNNNNDDNESYLIKKYITDRKQHEYINSIKLKSLRLENKDKYYNGDEKSFFEKYNSNNNHIFSKKWSSLNKNLKIIKLNEYFNNNKIDYEKQMEIKSLVLNNKLKKEIDYDELNGFIKNINYN